MTIKDTYGMGNGKTLFALASSKQASDEDARPVADRKWKARKGAAVAGGCSEYLYPGNLRYDSRWRGQDQGD